MTEAFEEKKWDTEERRSEAACKYMEKRHPSIHPSYFAQIPEYDGFIEGAKYEAEAIRANPALIWDTPPDTSSMYTVDIPVTGTESQATPLPEGEESKAIPELDKSDELWLPPGLPSYLIIEHHGVHGASMTFAKDRIIDYVESLRTRIGELEEMVRRLRGIVLSNVESPSLFEIIEESQKLVP